MRLSVGILFLFVSIELAAVQWNSAGPPGGKVEVSPASSAIGIGFVGAYGAWRFYVSWNQR